MKLTGVALVCLLLAALCLQGLDSQSMYRFSSNCCSTFMKTKMPQQAIRCYRSCSSLCPYKDSVIFKMKGNREICSSKTEKWVQYYMKRLPSCF